MLWGGCALRVFGLRQRRWVSSVAQSLLRVIDTASDTLGKIADAVQAAKDTVAEEADGPEVCCVMHVALHGLSKECVKVTFC